MNEQSTQPNSEVVQETETMLTKVQDLLRDAYASGWKAGYHKGFEFGCATMISRGLDIQGKRGDDIA
jgi:hypothetical protein